MKYAQADFEAALFGGRKDFSNADLRGLDFANLDLSGCDFRYSQLADTIWGVEMPDAKFFGAFWDEKPSVDMGTFPVPEDLELDAFVSTDSETETQQVAEKPAKGKGGKKGPTPRTKVAVEETTEPADLPTAEPAHLGDESQTEPREEVTAWAEPVTEPEPDSLLPHPDDIADIMAEKPEFEQETAEVTYEPVDEPAFLE